MAGEHVKELHKLYFAGRHGVLVNSNDGFYQRGKSYGMETKLIVAAKYFDHKERLGGLRPVLRKVAAECQVGWDFVAKIEQELVENDRVLTPGEIYGARDNPIRPGSMSMSREDFLCAVHALQATANTVLEKLCLVAILLHGDDRVGEHRVAVVSRRLPKLGATLCAESCPVRQVPAE